MFIKTLLPSNIILLIKSNFENVHFISSWLSFYIQKVVRQQNNLTEHCFSQSCSNLSGRTLNGKLNKKTILTNSDKSQRSSRSIIFLKLFWFSMIEEGPSVQCGRWRNESSSERWDWFWGATWNLMICYDRGQSMNLVFGVMESMHGSHISELKSLPEMEVWWPRGPKLDP